MKTLMLKFLAFVALVRASSQNTTSALQAITEMPQCARDCLAEVITHSPCSLTDPTCMCENTVVQGDMTTCVMSKCTIMEALATQNLTATSCGSPIRNKTHSYVVLSNVLGILSAVLVLQRFAYKIIVKLDLTHDDWVTLVTLLLGVPSTIINTVGVAANGLGRDIWTLPPDEITDFIRFFYILEVIYFGEIAMLKLALLFFYIRIFPGQWVRRLLWGTIGFSLAFGITFVVVAVLQCQPMSFYWTMWDGEHEGKCRDINAIAWSNAAISIALDGWILAIPLWQLRSLKLDWRRKIGVALMFCVGAFVTIVSILRLRSLIKFGSESQNPTWDFFDVAIWSTVEINVGLICVCLPSFRLLLVRIFPKLAGTTQRYYGKYSSNAAARSGTNNKRGSRPPLGNSASSRVDEESHSPVIEPNRIARHMTYAVEYGDSNDEVQLVYMTDTDMKSSKSDAS